MKRTSIARLLLPSGKARWRLFRLGLLTLLVALLEAAGIGSIAPLVIVLQSPDAFATTKAGSVLTSFLGATGQQMLLPVTMAAVALLFSVKATVTLAQSYASHRFAQVLYADLSTRVLQGYLAMPFSRHATANSAVLLRNVTTETRMIVDSIVLQSLTAASEVLVILLILFVLVWFDPAIAAAVALSGAAILAAGGIAIRRIGAREGREREETQAIMLKLAQSSISGIREVRIAGATKAFLERFASAAQRHGHAVTVIGWMQVVPRVVIEAAAILMVLGIFFHADRTGTESKTLPLLAVYLAAGYRLLPCLNRLYVSSLMIHYAWAGFRSVSPGLIEAIGAAGMMGTAPKGADGSILEAIGIGFSYPGSKSPVLWDVSITVRKGEMIGIVGTSGSGKTTLVNILLGLVPQNSGALTLDGVPVADEAARERLRATVAYVPQAPFIADDTLRANIVLGAAADEVNEERLSRAIELAQLASVVEALPHGLETGLGERAARLSGGEAQRIGIARAIYLDRPILVLDEATSALDQATEASLLQALSTLRQEKAIIAVSHRPDALAGCTRIYRVAGGKAAALAPEAYS